MTIPALGISNIVIRLASYRWLMVICPLVFAAAAFFYNSKLPLQYTAYARLLPPQTNNATADSLLKQVGGDANLGSAALSIKSPSDLYASLFMSRAVQQHVIEKYKLAQYYQIDDQDTLLMKVRKNTYVDVGKDGIITIGYTAPEPKLAAEITDSMLDAMYRLSERLAQQSSERRSKFYGSLVDNARKDLAAADRALVRLEFKTGLTRLKGQEEATAAALAELQGLIASREVELAKLSVSMTERHPDVVALREELAALRQQLGQIEASSGGKHNVFVPFDEYIDTRDLIEPARREVEMRAKVLEQLIQVQALAQMDETRDLSIIQILDQAIPPSMKSGPQIKRNVLAAAIVGFFFSIVLALAWEMIMGDPARKARWQRVFKAFLRLNARRVEPLE